MPTCIIDIFHFSYKLSWTQLLELILIACNCRVRQVKTVSLVLLDTLGNEVHLDQEVLLDNLEHLDNR